MPDSTPSSAAAPTTSAPPPAAPGGASPMPQVSDAGQKGGKPAAASKSSGNALIDQASQFSLAEKMAKGKPANDNAEPVAKREAPAAKEEGSAAEPKVEGKPTAAAPQKYKVKVDGKEVEVSIEDLQRAYSKASGAENRAKEAAELKKKVEAALNVIRSDTGAALKAAGLSDEQIEAFAVQLIAKRQREYLEQEKLKTASPEEKELYRLRQIEAQHKELQDRLAKQQREYEFNQTKAQISSLVISTLEELPKEYRRNDFVASRALDAWQYAWENQKELAAKGIKLTPAGVAKALRAEVEGLGKTLSQLQREAEGKPADAPKPGPTSTPGKPVVRSSGDRKQQGDRKEPLTQAQLLRQITLGER